MGWVSPWTTSQKEEAMLYWRKGMTESEIGHIMGRTKNSVHGMAHKNRFMFPSREKPASKQPTPEERQARAAERQAAKEEREREKAAKAQKNTRVNAGRAAAIVANLNRRAEAANAPPTLSVSLRAAFLPLLGSTPVPKHLIGVSACRWPLALGENVDPLMGSTTHYCGLPSAEGKSPYCPMHSRMGAGHGTQSERAAGHSLLKGVHMERGGKGTA